MKIAQVSPLFESVPPRLYGGTERVVHYLTEELVRQGHDVTLFASGDSVTSAKLASVCSEALRLNPNCVDTLACHLLQLEQVFRQIDDFDVVHFHTDYLHFPLSRRCGAFRHVTTLHGRLDIPELQALYDEYWDMPVASISNNQRLPLPQAHWTRTVYHGLPLDLYRPGKGQGDYLAFVGRISPEKGVDRAIEIAKRSGMKLKIAAKISKEDQPYFEQIRPLFDHPLVEFIGEVGEKEKQELVGRARALVFPIDWEEPFGLVMIEALACATPLIAWKRGSVPEIIDHGLSGYIVESMEEAVEAVAMIDRIDRRVCRQIFETRFSVSRMARDYVELYDQLGHEDSLDHATEKMTGTLNGRHYTSAGSVLRSRDVLSR